ELERIAQQIGNGLRERGDISAHPHLLAIDVDVLFVVFELGIFADDVAQEPGDLDLLQWYFAAGQAAVGEDVANEAVEPDGGADDSLQKVARIRGQGR